MLIDSSKLRFFEFPFLRPRLKIGVPGQELDIAGPAFVSKGHEYIKRGGTGFGVMSLLRFLPSL